MLWASTQPRSNFCLGGNSTPESAWRTVANVEIEQLVKMKRPSSVGVLEKRSNLGIPIQLELQSGQVIVKRSADVRDLLSNPFFDPDFFNTKSTKTPQKYATIYHLDCCR